MVDLVHVMVDLETLGTVPGCCILSIGAVVFDPTTGLLGDEHYVVIDLKSCEEAFLSTSLATLNWWEKQSPEAQQVLHIARSGKAPSLATALVEFSAWLAQQGNQKQLRIYGNGADFDNPILACAYDAVKLKMPATYGGRCYRQLKNLDELFGEAFRAPKLERGGTHHNALDDARTQALHLMEIIKIVKGVRQHG